MRDPASELRKLRRICRRAELHEDGGQPLVHLPELRIQYAGGVETVDGLLCPGQHSGYSSRLFLSKPFPARGQNWTTHNILGAPWHAMSWNGVDPSLGWDEILGAHLRPLQ
ncbi:MAG: hypothetical protein K0S56_3143 [Microvirga sp.]|uniref:hypothetical protein n=1 Tax=Aquabacter cavernae TaxID=2496029 RepID=UPI000F8EB819|nr:hypothetical protein [Aquabacter cavernae]MDF2812112.1 hypothetical protein [Microvirga sp.]